MNIMCFAPHPDDEVLACGGFLAKAVNQGVHVTVVYFAAGWSGTKGRSRAEATATREREAKAACQTLGIANYRFLRLADRQWQPTAKLTIKLATLLREFNPRYLLIPHADDADSEHRHVHTLAREATWMARTPLPGIGGKPLTGPLTVITWELWQPLPHPQLKIDITDVRTRVEQAFRKYQSQQGFAYWDWADSLHRYRGGYQTRTWAEAYSIISFDETELWRCLN